jgi:type IX secretion system PorP/SprF family membrane protein
MIIERTTFALLLYFSSIFQVNGQDPVFSQITSQPLLANPAFAGLHTGEVRASIQFKKQSELTTSSYKNQLSAFGIDTRYKAGSKDFWTLQGLISSFKIGDPSFVHQKVSLGGGYLKLLKAGRYGKGTQYLSLAFQFGLEQTFLASNTWFSNQYDTNLGTVNTTLPSGEPTGVTYASFLIPDLNAGVLWSNSWSKNTGIYAGVSLFHINEPKTGFIPNADTRLERKTTLIAGGEWSLTENTHILPVFYYLVQGPHQRISLGTPLRFNPRAWNDQALRAGIWLHGNQSDNGKWFFGEITFQTIFELKNIQLGLAYAIGQKPIQTSSFSRNSFEINFTWIKPADYKKKIICPRI